MRTAKTVRLRSPAKINLRLDVLRKREDGYHDIRTVLQKINLCDRLSFRLKREKGITISTDRPDLPIGRRNLVYQAAQMMVRRAGYGGGVDIAIEKEIPLGAGLGGGSSNAATTLKALNELLGLRLTLEELIQMGTALGADVPFFLMEGAALATGKGERLRRIELPEMWYLLINPSFQVSTRWAYQNFVLTRRHFRFNLQWLAKIPEGLSRLLWNDLEGVVSRIYTEIDEMKRLLLSEGALGALMTGSGPTVFGVFRCREEVEKAFKRLKERVRRRGWVILRAHSLSA